MLEEAGKLTFYILWTSVKFLFAPSTTYFMGEYNFWQTILISIAGGWLGTLVFYYGGSLIFDWIAVHYKPKQKTFSRKNRFIIWLKNSFGVTGMAIILGVGSIPIVCLVTARYFRSNPLTIYYLLSSIVVWSFILTAFSVWLKDFFV
ncbi:hypothetical protein KFE98_21640 [bacterium SCSIO 12741]|nr:hypothetical protein KFE98_21640 [bacterium SCSIO 12741]